MTVRAEPRAGAGGGGAPRAERETDGWLVSSKSLGADGFCLYAGLNALVLCAARDRQPPRGIGWAAYWRYLSRSKGELRRGCLGDDELGRQLLRTHADTCAPLRLSLSTGFSFFTGGAEAPGETSDHWMDTYSADLRSKVNSFNDAVNETINYIGDLVTEVIYGEEDDDYMEEGNEKREDETGAVSGGAGASGRLKKRRTKPSGGGKAD